MSESKHQDPQDERLSRRTLCHPNSPPCTPPSLRHISTLMTNAPPIDPNRPDHLTQKGEEVYAGTHLIIDIHSGHHLDDQTIIEQAMRDATDATGATLLHIHTHRFSPQGVTGIAILAESHIACHTWPEIGYGAFDVFMCGDTNPHAAIPILKAAFETEDVLVVELHRGRDAMRAST